ncbi:MAG: pilus assembly protein PilM [Patescibacteria group bacterium]
MDFSFSNLFNKKDQKALGIDIGSSSIKVVELRKKGNKAILETYGELSLGPYSGVSVGQATKLSTGKLSLALGDLLKEKEVGITTRNAGLAIPFHASLLSVIEMPYAKDKELATMVPIEARKYIPVPISDVTLDWSIIPKFEVKGRNQEVADEMQKKMLEKAENFGGEDVKPEKVDILLAAIHNNIISDYQEIVANVGLVASFFEIELFSTIRSVLDEDIHTAMIFDMGAASTKLYIVERGIIRNSHIINRGAQDITATIARMNNISFEDAEVLKRGNRAAGAGDEPINIEEAVKVTAEYIFSEANRVLFFYQKQNNKNVDKIILVGGGSAMKGWAEICSQYFKVEVVAGHPFSKVEAPAFLEEILRETGPEFAVSVGVALRKLKEL